MEADVYIGQRSRGDRLANLAEANERLAFYEEQLKHVSKEIMLWKDFRRSLIKSLIRTPEFFYEACLDMVNCTDTHTDKGKKMENKRNLFLKKFLPDGIEKPNFVFNSEYGIDLEFEYGWYAYMLRYYAYDAPNYGPTNGQPTLYLLIKYSDGTRKLSELISSYEPDDIKQYLIDDNKEKGN